ncbi:kielin/chordin-like protein isoform X1 [Cotesia typhae]
MGSTRIAFTCYYLLFVAAIFAEQACDKSKCPGPTKYYKDLRCTPVYRSPEDCCPYKYNCDHLYNRSLQKCYINGGHEYEIGEKLREEDRNPCDIGCICRNGRDNIAKFICAQVDCFYGPVTPGCYRKISPSQCCPGEEVCPEKPEDRATCEVDGKIYKDGEYFKVASEPEKTCVCQPGYTGENVPPFCIELKSKCSPENRHPSDIHNRCAPVYYSSQSPQSSCSVFSRCQNSRDQVIKKNETSTSDQDMTCKFGNLTMNAGDELNQATDYNSVCIKCVCEVGPVLTCQRLPSEECDISKHPPFEI